MKQVIAVNKMYDLIIELTARVQKFPRDYKYVLGNRILENIYTTLDNLVEACYTKDKITLLRTANINLERLRFQIRLSKDYRIISLKQYEYISKQINEVGKLVGGWIRSRNG